MCLTNKDCTGKGGYCTPTGECSEPTSQYDPCDPLAHPSCPDSLICDDYSKSCLSPTEFAGQASKKEQEGRACVKSWQCRYDYYCDSEFVDTSGSTPSTSASDKKPASGTCRKRKGLLEQCTVPTTSTLALKHSKTNWYDDECLNGFICYPEHKESNVRVGKCHKRCLVDKDCTGDNEECTRFSELTSIKACAYKTSHGAKRESKKGDNVGGGHVRLKDFLKDNTRNKPSTTTTTPPTPPPVKPQQPVASSSTSKITLQNTALALAAGVIALVVVAIIAIFLYRTCKRDNKEQEGKHDNAEEFLDDLSKPWWARRDLLRKHKKHQKEMEQQKYGTRSKEDIEEKDVVEGDIGDAVTAIPIRTPSSNQAIIRTPKAVTSTTEFDVDVSGGRKGEYMSTVRSPNKW